MDAYPNIEAVIEGRVSGHVTEWPVLRQELKDVMAKLASKEERILVLEKELQTRYANMKYSLCENLDQVKAENERLRAELGVLRRHYDLVTERLRSAVRYILRLK